MPTFKVKGVTITQVKVDTAASGATALVPAVAGHSAVLCGGFLLADSAVAVKFQDTDGNDLSGPLAYDAGTRGMVLPGSADHTYLGSAVGKGIRLHLGGAVQVSGVLQFRYYRQ